MQRLKSFIKKHPGGQHLLVGLFYLFFTFYYMTPQFLHCNTTVYGFGDNTAGPIWHQTVSPNNPLWGHENVSNFPSGENLYNPVNYSAGLQYSLDWVLAKPAGVVCSYNLVNIFGFVISASVMYGFVYAFTRKRWIAILAGYIVAFSPYFQVKSGGHQGYGYQALLIGIIWAFFNLLKRQKKKEAAIFGLLIATSFYWDPYFPLLAFATLFPLLLVWLAINFRPLLSSRAPAGKKQEAVSRFKFIALGLAIAGLLISPLAYLRIKDSNQINSFVTAARGDVLFEARACSILPNYYFLPFVLHPWFSDVLGAKNYKTLIDTQHNHFKCGIGEDTVGLSLVMLGVVLVGLVIFPWEKLNGRRLRLSRAVYFDHQMLFWGAIAGALFASALALPPVKLHGIPSPSYVLLSLTTTWRTLARLFVVVNIFTTSLFSLFLAYFYEHFKSHRKLLKYLFAAIFVIVIFEYQAFQPFKGNTLSNFNFKKDAPPAYYWLQGQKTINSIAEYPIERAGGESDATSYYLTMQLVHKKKIFNSALPNGPQEIARTGLKDLSDPQTIPVLHSLGIDAVVVHGVPVGEVAKIPYLQVIYTAPQANFNLLPHTPTVTYDNIVIAKINADAPQSMGILELSSGFPRNTLIIHTAANWEYEAVQDSLFSIAGVSRSGFSTTDTTSTSIPVCFDVKMAAAGDTDQLIIKSDGHDAYTIGLNDGYQRVVLTARHSIKLHNLHGHNMRIQNLGCSVND